MPYIIVRTGFDTRQINFHNQLTLTGEDGNRFRLGAPVRTGGNGVVFRADRLGPYNRNIGQCAVKLLKQLDDVRRDRFANEIRILKALKHDCIAGYYDSGTTTLGTPETVVPWMAMDMGHKNLREEVDQHGPVTGEGLLVLGIQACKALQCIHKEHIIHRDIKPQNFVYRNEDNDALMMIDFGIAKFIGENVAGRPMDQFTATMEFVGPVFFASPELIQYARDKNHPVDQRSDLFQLGKVLWFVATNTVSAGVISKAKDPFGGKLWDLCISLLQDDPADRPQTAAEVEQALQSI